MPSSVIPPRPTLWNPNIDSLIHCRSDGAAFDTRVVSDIGESYSEEEAGPPLSGPPPIARKRSRLAVESRDHVDSKMQCVLHEDMLDEEKRETFAWETETLLGESPVAVPFALPPLPAMPILRPDGPPPFPSLLLVPIGDVKLHDSLAARGHFPARNSLAMTHSDSTGCALMTPLLPDNCQMTYSATNNGHAMTPASVKASAATMTPASAGALASVTTHDSAIALALATTPAALGPGGFSGSSLRHVLQSILDWQAPSTQRPSFSFRFTKLVAKTNWERLQSFNMDLGLALQDEPYSTLTTGSEFHPASVLEPLCHYHPLWPRVKQYLTTGVAYPLEPLPESDRVADLQANYERGNHKSANKHMDRLGRMLQVEVERGWQLILPKEIVTFALLLAISCTGT